MTTRQQRRRAAREAAKDPRHGKSEVFTYTDENDEEQWLDVESLRRWAEENLSLVGIEVDMVKVEDMFQNGRLDQDHLRNHTMTNDIRPVLVCNDFAEGRSEIVDGNHTYAMMAAGLAMASREGIIPPTKPLVPAYVIDHEIWSHFIVPPEARG